MQDDDPAEVAFADGENNGQHLPSTAGDCPFDVDQMPLRQRWLDGFSAGRIRLDAAQPVGSFDKEDSPEAQTDRPPAVEGR